MIDASTFVNTFLTKEESRRMRVFSFEYRALTPTELQSGTGTTALGTDIAELIEYGAVFVEGDSFDLAASPVVDFLFARNVFSDYTADEQAKIEELIKISASGELKTYRELRSDFVGVNAFTFSDGGTINLSLTDVYFTRQDQNADGSNAYDIAAGQASPEFFTRAIDAESPSAPDGPYVDLATALANAGL